MILLYVLMIFLLGYLITSFLNKYKIILKSDYTFLEIISNSFIVGLIFIVIYYLIYGLVTNYNFIMFYPIFIIDLLGLITFINDIKNKKYSFKKSLLNKNEKRINIILNILLLITFIYFSIYALTSNVNSPDEFSLWGRLSKAIFLEKGFINLNTSVGVSYPLSMPLLYSGYYFFIGSIKSNQIRFITTIITILFSMNFLGRSKRKNYDILLSKILLLVFLNLNVVVKSIASNLYVDIIIMFMYSMGFLYLCDFNNNGRKSDLLLFIIFNSFVTCIKPDGFFLSIISIITMIIFCMIKKIRKEKCNIDYKNISFSILVCTFVYICYKVVYQFLLKNNLSYIAPSAYDSKFINLDILNRAIDNGFKQMFNEKEIVVYSIFLIVLIAALISKKVKIKKENTNNIILCTICYIGNLLFLYLAFIYQFGGEGVLAPSITRYMTRVTPLIFEIVLILFMEYKESKK